MTARDAARAHAIGGLTAAALVGWFTGSVAWGVVTALTAFIVHHGIEFRAFGRWSRHPLGRPPNRDGAWQATADRLHRTIELGRRRSRNLLATLRRLRTTTETIPDGWVILRADGEIEDYNRGARAHLGLSASDLGQNLVALVRSPEIVALLRGEVDSDIVEISAPADETRRIELRRIAIDAERTLVMARDVTELNRLLTMRQDFVANVSHELRTPLTVIVGYLEELDEGSPDFETLREVLPKLTPPARRMRALVDDLLTLTRLESAPLPSDETTEDIDVALMLHTIVAEARQLSAGAHDLVLQADPDLRFRGVSTELYSAFNNLVTNAVRYSPDGGTVNVRWFESAAGPRFEVEDRGMGIAPEHLTRITERFYRIDLAGARVRGGTGLGLAIVKHVLRRHGSVLQVESELAKGSLFYCVFGQDTAATEPAADVHRPTLAPVGRRGAAGQPPGTRAALKAGAHPRRGATLAVGALGMLCGHFAQATAEGSIAGSGQDAAASATATEVVTPTPYRRVSGISGNLSSVGSDTLANLMTLWSESFKRHYPNVNIQVQAAGSSTAPPALTQGTSSLGPMSRLMKDGEMAAFESRFGYRPTAVRVAIDALALYVHKDNPIAHLRLGAIDAAFSVTRRCGGARDITTWGDLGLRGAWADEPIQMYGRNSVSGTYGYFKKAALCSGDFKDTVNEQPGSASVVQAITSSVNGIGYSGIGYLTAGVRAVPLIAAPGQPAVDASGENVRDRSYPLARNLYVYVNKRPDADLPPLEAEFLKLVLSATGQAAVAKDGYIALSPRLAARELGKIQ